MNEPKFGWRPDSTQPLKEGRNSHEDWTFHDNYDLLAGVRSQVSDPSVESGGVLDLRKWCSPIEDQSSAGSCVGNGVVGALEFLQIRNGLPYTDLSRLFVYYNSRLQHRDTDKDSGTYIRLAFGTLTSLGTCSERSWPYDLNNLYVRPSWRAYQEAYPNKIKSYYRIEDATGVELVNNVKNALRSQHPVVFGMMVDQEFVDFRGTVVSMPKSGRVLVGGHCMVIVGYDDNVNCWIVRNSWGTRWGSSGYAYIPYEYLDESSASDFWVPYLPK